MRRLSLTALAMLLVGVGSVASAGATPITNGVGISSPAITIGFDELGLPSDTVVTDQYSAAGVTFSPNLFQNPQSGFVAPNVDSGPASLSDFSFDEDFALVDAFSIFFTLPQNSAAFAMITNPGLSTFQALLNGVAVESFDTTTGYTLTDDFYGFTGITFDEIRVRPGGWNGSAILDNLQLGTAPDVQTRGFAAEQDITPAPEPASLVLLGTGLIAAATGVRRRRSRP